MPQRRELSRRSFLTAATIGSVTILTRAQRAADSASPSTTTRSPTARSIGG